MDIVKNSSLLGNVRSLPSSKSLSNRALIINALTEHKGTLENLSTARDTQLMHALLHSNESVIDVMDAGTTMRFLTAYFSVTGRSKMLTGSDRMKERPIHLLVDALRKIGVSIDYKGKEGFPPIETKGFARQLTNRISIRGDVSSQFISALMMTAPTLPEGLTIDLEGKIGSLPYLMMTAELMALFGIRPEMSEQQIRIAPGQYKPAFYRVEPDWSAASYWFGFTALATSAEILLPDVDSFALQGDRVIVDIMSQLGVEAAFNKEGLRLTKSKSQTEKLIWDFTNCPDLAQTILPVCAVKNIPGEFTGLESLRIKETDRIAALQAELIKVGAQFIEDQNQWRLIPGKIPTTKPVIETYHDHRMAMGFAPLATQMDISIQVPDVVRKSYPTFWDDMKGLGFSLKINS
ncbi:MAG: 3-phosphoshikimate 1-carboxyvinyltransferase [Cyclobacteriaceae bacterium]|nr:3-phosphoshikimate 1-carboxyvinyltransferase [Cyclobacteriaceae bacterium]